MDNQVNSKVSTKDYKKLERSLLHAQEMLMKEHKELSNLFRQVEQGKQE